MTLFQVYNALVDLKNDVARRRRELNAAHEEARFSTEVREMEAWVSDKINAIRIETERYLSWGQGYLVSI